MRKRNNMKKKVKGGSAAGKWKIILPKGWQKRLEVSGTDGSL